MGSLKEEPLSYSYLRGTIVLLWETHCFTLWELLFFSGGSIYALKEPLTNKQTQQLTAKLAHDGAYQRPQTSLYFHCLLHVIWVRG